MSKPATRLLLLLFVLTALAMPALADVTISGTTSFASLDGSALDDDHAVNGVFTVNGNLTVLGTINCNDDGAGSNSACPMQFVVSGNFVMASGSALYAENRKGFGNGGNVSVTAGGNITLQGPSGTLGGALISTTRLTGANPAGSDHAGNITLNAGGTTSLAAGSMVTAGALDGMAGQISVTGNGAITVAGIVIAGPTNTLNPSGKYTGSVVSGGAAQMTGGSITIQSLTHSEPGLVITGDAIIATQGETPGTGPVTLAACNIQVSGLVASLARAGLGARVVLRSGTDITVDGRDLGGSGTRNGMLRSDATQQSANTFTADLFARNNIHVYGPATGSLFAVTSNGGATSKDASGTINVVSTGGTATASGNAFEATGSNNGDQGGTVNVSAKSNVTLDGATIKAAGDYASTDSARAGGHVNVRSYSGSVSWQAGVGDVRPTGSASGVPAAQQGTISLTYCTSVSTSGSSFPSNGSPVGVFPTTAQSCSPAAPALPAGNQLPDCNDPPVANNDTYTVLEGGTLNVPAPGVLANDADPEGQPITAILVSGPSHATSFALNADGSFTYVHDGSETTLDSFTYKANDGSLDSNVATVTIHITPVNDPPLANNDSYSVNEDTPLNVAAPGVLANDTDPDGPTMTAILVSGPSHASSFALNPNGSFNYQGALNFNGSDSFTYQVSDGSLLSNTATVTITVNAVNDAPVANNDSYTTDEDTPLSVAAPGVLGNDSDVDSPTIHAVLVSGPSHAASFALNANGSFSYTPAANYNGSDSFTYKANDGSLDSNVATVSITINAVNDAPVAQPDSYATNEDTTLTVNAPGVLANDSDVDSPTIHAVLVTGASNGAVNLNADGSFIYTPNANFNGTDTFTYKANDGSLDSNIVTVTITVAAVNDPPALSAPSSVATNEDTAYAFSGTISVSDIDAGSGNVTVTLAVSNGTLTLSGTSGLTVSGNGTANITATGTLADLNNALNGLTYLGNANFNGADALAVTANDNGNTGLGGPLTDSRTVSITVNAVNDAPVNSVPGTQTVAEDTTLTFSAANNNAITVSDVDAGNNAIQVTLTATNGTISLGSTNNVNVSGNGTSSLTVVGAISDINAALDGATFLATLNFNGTATITVATDDLGNSGSGGSQTDTDSISINVTPVNDAPVANNDGPYSVTTGGTFTLPAPGVLANDTDVDSPSLTAVLVSGPAHASSFALHADGSFTYVNDGTSGTFTFTYKANDGSLDSNTATVTIVVSTQPPVANADNYTGVGNTELRVGLGAGATPAAIVSGSVLDNDTDADTPHSGLSVSAFDATSANGGTVSMASNGTFSYLPAIGFTGVDSFHYTVTDGSNTATGTVTITITTRVWYVNNAGANGSGRSNSPFNNLLSAQTASFANDVVYVHSGSGTYAGGIALKNGQSLVGNGVALIVSSYVLNGAGARPTIGTGVTLASANLVTGLNVAAGGIGISGSSSNAGTIDQVNVSGGSDGISLVSPSGTFTITSVNLTPGGAGLVISGGTGTVSASNLAVTTTTGTGIQATGGTLNVSGTSTVSTSSGTAIDLSGINLGVTLSSVSASNGVTGIKLANTTGSFAANGGTIANMTQRGLSAQSATNVSLSGVTFTNAATTNGDTAANCSNLATGSNLTCNAAIWLQNVTGASFTGVTVNGSAQIGINGNGVNGFSLVNSEVKNAGNEAGESGVQFQNLSGTVTLTNANLHDNASRQMYVENLSGSMTMNVTGSTFSNSPSTTGSHGLFVSTRNAATATVIIGSSTFADNLGNGIQFTSANNASSQLTVNGSTFANESAGINVQTANAASATFSITNNPFSGMAVQAINIARALPNTGSLTGTISDNTIGTNGVAGSACAPFAACDGIDIRSFGASGTLAGTLTNNAIHGVTGGGISASAASGANSMQLKIAGNTLTDPTSGSSGNAIFVQSGSVSTDTTSVCADIVSNTITGSWDDSGSGTAIRVRNRFAGTTFRLPGYAGAGNSTSQVAAFLSGQNGGASASATINSNVFGGGSACVTP
jgi:large repetitive protein